MKTANGQITIVDMNDGDSELYIRLSSSFGTLPMDNKGMALSDLNQYNVTAAIYYGTEAQAITKAEAKTIDSDVWIENVKSSAEDTYPLTVSKDEKSVSFIITVGGSGWTNDNPWVDITLQCANGAVTKRYNIFGQRAGDTGTSVKVQYSSDTLSWHTSFVENDIWMRVSSSDGTWGSPIRVVGEKGDGGAWTDYSYNTSSLLTTSNVYTAPSDIAAWYDAPIATTSGKPYLWMRVQKYADTDTKDGAPTYLRITGEKGADGTSVNIKGYVAGWVGDIGQVITNDESLPWAVDDPHCIYIASTVEEREVKDGEGYLIKAYELDGETYNEGHLIVSSDGKWLDCGKITGEAGADGKTMYLHIAYANSADGSKDFTTDDDGGKTRSYMGTYADFVATDSTNYKNYYWKPYKGEKGDNGESALYIVATPDSDSFPAGADGYADKASKHTVTARLYYGTVAQEDWTVEVCTADDANWYTAETLKEMAGDIQILSVKKNGADCIVTYEVGESNWTDDNAFIAIRMTNKYGSVMKQINCFAQRRGTDATYIEVSPSNLILEQELSNNIAQALNNFNVNLNSAKFKIFQVVAGARTDITSLVQLEYDSSLMTLSLTNGYQKITRIKSLSKNSEITVTYGDLSVILPIYINTVGTWAQDIKGDTMEAVSTKEWTAVDNDGVVRYYDMESLVKQAADGLLTKAYKTIEVKTVNNFITVKNNQQSYTEYSLSAATDSNIKVLLDCELESAGDNGFVVVQLTGKKGNAAEWASDALRITKSGQYELSFSEEVISLADVSLRFLCRNCNATVTVLRISQGLSSYIKQTAEGVTIDAANVSISNSGNLAALFNGGNLLLNKAFACPRLSDGTFDTSHPTVDIDGETGILTCNKGVFNGAMQASTIGYAMNVASIKRDYVTSKKSSFQVDGEEEKNAVVSCLTVESSIYYLNSSRIKLVTDASDAGDLEEWGYENIIWAIPSAENIGNRMLDIYFYGLSLALQTSEYQVYLAIGNISDNNKAISKDGIAVPNDGNSLNIEWATSSTTSPYFYNPSLYSLGGNSSAGLRNFLPLRTVTNGKYGQLPRHIRLMSLCREEKWNWYILSVE